MENVDNVDNVDKSAKTGNFAAPAVKNIHSREGGFSRPLLWIVWITN